MSNDGKVINLSIFLTEIAMCTSRVISDIECRFFITESMHDYNKYVLCFRDVVNDVFLLRAYIIINKTEGNTLKAIQLYTYDGLDIKKKLSLEIIEDAIINFTSKFQYSRVYIDKIRVDGRI